MWKTQLRDYRRLSEKEQDKYMTMLQDSMLKLTAADRDTLIEYMEFLEENVEADILEVDPEKTEKLKPNLPET